MCTLEQHLEKTPIQYIQWRYQDGHDRELLEKVTRVLTDEEKAQMEVPFVGKNGTTRKLEVTLILHDAEMYSLFCSTVHSRPTEAKEVLPI